MTHVHPHDETQRITGVPRLHSRPLRTAALLMAVVALGVAVQAWRSTRGHAFRPVFPSRLASDWPAGAGIRPQSGVVLAGRDGRTLAWVDLEGSVHAERAAGQVFPPLLGVRGASGALLAFDMNADGTEDLVFATSDRQLLGYDGRRGTRLAASEWFAEPILGAPVLCAGADGQHSILVHSAAGKIARYAAGSLAVAGHEVYHRTGTRGPASAYDVDGDGLEDAIMGDDSGRLLWLNSVSGESHVIEPVTSPGAASETLDSDVLIRSAVCGFDFTDDGLLDWVYGESWGAVFVCDGQGRLLSRWSPTDVDSTRATRPPSPVLADLDSDGTPEIIVAHPAGAVYAFQAPRTFPGPLSILWKACTDDTIHEEVALADLTGDEVSEVVVVTRDGALTVLDGRQGDKLQSWDIGVRGSPLIEDLTGDGLLELVAPKDSTWAVVETGSRAYPGNTWPTWRGDGGRTGRRDSLPGWPPRVWWSVACVLLVAASALWWKS